MKELLVPIISALFGGALGAFYNYKGKKDSNIATRENIYADHTEKLWERLDNLSTERDELKAQNIELNAQVKQLTKQTRELKNQVSDLKKQVHELTMQISHFVKEEKGQKGQLK